MEGVEKLIQRDRFAILSKIELLETGEGYARAGLVVENCHLNGSDVCQGGVIFTLADLAFAAAVNSHGGRTVSVSCNITYLKPALLGDHIYAEAREIVDHHRLPYAEVRVANEAGDILAIFTAMGYRKQ